MKTPYGKECPYFYGDYRRGRNHEECRLLLDNNLEWQSKYCQRCEIPEIKMANACENMQLIPKIDRPFLIGPKQVTISAYCHKSQETVADPRIGCGQCHPIEFIFLEEDKK